MFRRTLSYIAAVLLITNLSGCVTSHFCEEAVRKHLKPDDFSLGTACMSDAEVILKVFGKAAGENGNFDIYINKTNLASNPIQQPIEVPRRIKATITNECPVGSTALSTDRKKYGRADGNASVSKTDEDQQFVYSENGGKVTFKIEEETHQPNLYMLLFTPLTLMADVIVTPILFILPGG